MSQFEQKTLAGLDILERSAREANFEDSTAVVLLHGYGADFQDLAVLADMLDPEQKQTWIFPNGPLTIALGWAMEGHAWFPIDVMELQMSAARGERLDFENKTPGGFLEISSKVRVLFEEIQKKYKNFYVGGFSQGAMVSCDAALSMDRPPQKLILLSGTLAAKDRWDALLTKFQQKGPQKSLEIFQSHGREDPVLPFQGANELKNLFDKHANPQHLAHFWHPFSGGHEIPPQVLTLLSAFLK